MTDLLSTEHVEFIAPLTGVMVAIEDVPDPVFSPNPTGLHARPAATCVGLAKRFRSDIRLRRGEDSANGKSIAAKPAPPRSDDPNLLLGVSASPGLGIGTVVQLRHNDIEVDEFANDHHSERRKLNSAIDRALLDLSALQKRLEEDASADKAAIFAAHQELLSDPDVLDLAASGIDKGKSAPVAWRNAFNSFADQLAGLSNEILAGRAGDVRDVGQRVLEELTGQRSERAELRDATILLAEELTPSDTAQLDRTKVVGFATTSGGASSHVAIIARSLDIPAVAGIESRALDIADGSRVILDGSHGSLQLNATDADIEHILTRQRVIAEREATEEAAKDELAITTDGHRVKVVANIGGVEDAKEATTRGAEGVGLLRSEFVFMDRSTAPSEAELYVMFPMIATSRHPVCQGNSQGF